MGLTLDVVQARTIRNRDSGLLMTIAYPGHPTIHLNFTVVSREHLSSQEDTNAFVATLSPQRQLRLYEIYSEIPGLVVEPKTGAELLSDYTKLVDEICEIVPLRLVEDYVFTHLTVPPEIADVYRHNDDTLWTPEQTYLKGDYRNVQMLALYIRLIIPFLSSIYSIATSITGEKLKDVMAGDWITGLAFTKYVLVSSINDPYLRQIANGDTGMISYVDMPPIQRLEVYYTQCKISMGISFIPESLAGIPEYMMDKKTVFQLIIKTIGGIRLRPDVNGDTPNIASHLSSKAKSLSKMPSTPASAVREKRARTGGDDTSDSADGASTPDSYRAATSTTIGQTVALRHVGSDTAYHIKQFGLSQDRALVEELFVAAEELLKHPFNNNIILLAKYLTPQTVVPLMSFDMIDGVEMTRLLAILFMYFVKNGHKEVGALLLSNTVVPLAYMGNYAPDRLVRTEDTDALIETIYPHVMKPGKVQKNPAEDSLNKVAATLMFETNYLVLPPALLKEFDLPKQCRTPPHLATMLLLAIEQTCKFY